MGQFGIWEAGLDGMDLGLIQRGGSCVLFFSALYLESNRLQATKTGPCERTALSLPSSVISKPANLAAEPQ